MEYNRRVLLTRRRRDRRLNSRPNIFMWVLRIVAVVLLVVVLVHATVAAAALGTAYGVYSFYSKDLPDPRAIETEQEEFEF